MSRVMTAAATIRIGTCSWTERSLVESGEFYPKGISSPEERLRYYASRFDTVEVDSSYYAIPSVQTTGLWAERTPSEFVFHLKAYGALTGHGIVLKSLPAALRALLPAAVREQRSVRVEDTALLKAIAEAFVASCAPLRAAGKLGVVVFQFPPWFVYRTGELDRILRCRELMGDLPIAVEFRHGSWLTERRRNEVLGFLRDNAITYVTADEPQYGTLATVPFLAAATTGTAYLRLHGRNRETWLRKGIDTSLRYDYLYPAEELKEFVAAAGRLATEARVVYLMFNNCRLGHAMKNALETRRISGVPSGV